MDNHSHHNHEHHKHSSHESHMSSPEAASDFLKRFWIVTALLIPLLLLSEFGLDIIGIESVPFRPYIQLGIATVIFYFSLVFFEHAKHEIKARQYGMMTLVSLAVAAGFGFSALSTFFPQLQGEFYLEISTLIWILLFGHYLEAKSSNAAGDALQEVAKLLPKKAHKLVDGNEKDVSIEDLEEGDIVIVKPGEKVPADGTIKKGDAHFNESHISGESKPIAKSTGDSVVAGSIAVDGTVQIKLDRVGENSTIGQIQQLISEAQSTKPRAQKIADKAAGILTFAALGSAVIAVVAWSVILNQPFIFSFTLAITALVIACPHALGLAIPTVSTIATSLAVKNGIFLKDMSKIEVVKNTNWVIFDKTGTLTKGEFGVTDIVPVGDNSEKEVLKLAATLESHASHVIGLSIVNHAKKKKSGMYEMDSFKNVAGKGIRGTIKKTEYFLGNKEFISKSSNMDEKAHEMFQELSDKGQTVVALATKKSVLGFIALADTIKEESKEAVKKLHDQNIKVAMLTGDNKHVAESVSKELGIDTYFAEVLPEDKYKHIEKLQGENNTVMMVGDGINDAPALTQAHVGVAVGAGTDVAVEAGDIVLTRSNPMDIVRLLELSHKVHNKMVQNLIWATGYNVIALPAAIGAFAPWGIFLRPQIGALLMALSSVIVVINALMLKRAKLS